MSSPADTTPTNSGNAVRALRNIAIAALVMGGLFFAYSKYVDDTKNLKELSKKSFDLLQRDNPREYREAAKMLDDALAIRSNDPFAVSARAEVAALLWVEHGLADSAATAKELVERAQQKEFNLAERFSAQGLSLIGEGKPEQAATELGELAKSAGHAKVVAALGMANVRLGKAEAARHDLKAAADRDWRSPRFVSLYADTFFEQGDFLSAQNTYAKALELNPAHLRSLIGKARADVARNERVEEAKAAIAEVLAKGDDELTPVLKARGLAGRAEVQLASGSYAEAEATAREAIGIEAAKIDPAFAYGHYALGLALAAQKKDGAFDALKAAIALHPHVQRFYYQGALALASAGRVSEGEELFKLAEATLKKNDVFHVAMGDFLVATAQLDKAHAAYDEAIKANEVNPEAYYKKGMLFQAQANEPKANKRKLFDDARQQYEKAVGIRSKYPEVYRQMGLIYMDVQPTSSEALENFVKALNFYKEQKAPKRVFEEFITEVEQRYVKAKLKSNAEAWRKEASALAR